MCFFFTVDELRELIQKTNLPAGVEFDGEPPSNEPKLYEVSLESGECTPRNAAMYLTADDRDKTNVCFVLLHGRSASIWMSKRVNYDYNSFNRAMERVKGDPYIAYNATGIHLYFHSYRR